ncbi:MAG: PDDEXK nuclease domain-containing protein [Bacteroidetes bacterium]|nr:PDDEXK nuclease domain-containing protein [Bacteroidota bacterium]
MNELLINEAYLIWLNDLKSKIKQSQIKASLAVNCQLILLYWELGGQIVEKQEKALWGSGFINQLSKDLQTEFPEMSGFSKRNIELIRQWFLFYRENFVIAKQLVSQLQSFEIELNSHQCVTNSAKNSNLKQLGSNLENNNSEIIPKSEEQFENSSQNIREISDPLFQIPWGHHILIIQKIKNAKEAYFYISETIANNWSRSVLEYQIETKLYVRQGKAITNFAYTLPEVESDLANALLKDPYNFEFLTLSSQVKERELEQKLVQNITQFLLELGKGFAYMGRQFPFTVGGKVFRTDLLFYHTRLKCYIVLELKVTEFEPEYLGKLNFYLTVINELIKEREDKPTIGILLCKNKNSVVVDFALKDINKPMGVSEFTYTELPDEIKNALPTAEQFTQQLNLQDGKD